MTIFSTTIYSILLVDTQFSFMLFMYLMKVNKQMDIVKMVFIKKIGEKSSSYTQKYMWLLY